MISGCSPDEKIIQSYVVDKYFVSTILRDYVTIEGVSRGHETKVFSWDLNTRNLGEVLYQTGETPNHFDICKKLIAKGAEGLTDFEDD